MGTSTQVADVLPGCEVLGCDGLASSDVPHNASGCAISIYVAEVLPRQKAFKYVNSSTEKELSNKSFSSSIGTPSPYDSSSLWWLEYKVDDPLLVDIGLPLLGYRDCHFSGRPDFLSPCEYSRYFGEEQYFRPGGAPADCLCKGSVVIFSSDTPYASFFVEVLPRVPPVVRGVERLYVRV